MADYVEKFKASDPFNMAGFNAKIDQINTAVGGGVTAANEAKTEAQAAATVANQALAEAQKAGLKMKQVWTNPGSFETGAANWDRNPDAKFLIVTFGNGPLTALETMAVVVPIATVGSGSITKTHVTYNGHIILVCKQYTLTENGITFGIATYAEIYSSTNVTQSEAYINIKTIYECA